MNTPNIRFKDFTKDWNIIKLNSLMSFNNGINAEKDSYGHGRKFINVLDILNNNFIKYKDIIGSVSVSEKVEKSNKVEYGDLLFLRSSETRKDVGKSSVYLDEDEFALFGGFVIRGKKQVDYHPYFLKLNLESPKVRNQISSKAGGSTRFNVSQSILSSIEISIPSQNEQEKIADFISYFDKKIQLQQEKIDLLKEQKKGYMQKIFSQELRFKDENTKDFPDWENNLVKDVLSLNLRGVPKPTSAYTRLGLRSHAKGTFHELVSDVDSVNMDTLYEVHDGDFIINITFAWEQALAVADEGDHGKLVSHRFPTYRFKETHEKNFYKHFFMTKYFKYCLRNASPGGAGRNRVLNKTDFMKINITVPTFKEQIKIGNFFDTLQSKINLAEQTLQILTEQKKAFMQQMFI